MENKKTELITTEGILHKIKTFFKRLFNKKNIEKNKEIKQKQDFRSDITVKVDEEQIKLLELQEKFRNKEISGEDISSEDLDKLNKLYEEQIQELQDKITQNIIETENYKEQIILIKEQIKKG